LLAGVIDTKVLDRIELQRLADRIAEVQKATAAHQDSAAAKTEDKA